MLILRGIVVDWSHDDSTGGYAVVACVLLIEAALMNCLLSVVCSAVGLQIAGMKRLAYDEKDGSWKWEVCILPVFPVC